MTAADVVALAVGVLAAIYDFRARVVPNVLTYSALVTGMALSIFPSGISLTSSLLGAAVGFLPSLILFQFRQIGGGDVKLLAAIGSLVGPVRMIDVIFYSVLGGLLICVAMIVLHRRTLEFLRSTFFIAYFFPVTRQVSDLPVRDLTIPFAVPVAIGIVAESLAPLQVWVR